MAEPNKPLLDLESVRCFVEAYRQPSFRAAAHRVHLSPAAFGERIARLEAELGSKLFDRTTRRVEATLAAARLLPRAEALLDAERSIRRAELEEDAAVPPFAITLGTRFELGMSWLLPALPELGARRPERTLHLAFADTEGLIARLHARRLDALVSSARISVAGLAYSALHDEHYTFVGAPSTLESAPLCRAEHARRHVLIDARSDLPLFRYFLDAAPPEPSWVFARHEYLGTIAAVRARARDGFGVAVLPRYYVEEDLEQGRLVPILSELEPKQDVFRLIWRSGHPLEVELRQLAEELRRLPLK